VFALWFFLDILALCGAHGRLIHLKLIALIYPICEMVHGRMEIWEDSRTINVYLLIQGLEGGGMMRQVIRDCNQVTVE
jgi:hypothetical protein